MNLLLLLFLPLAHAGLRFGCSTLTIQRLDPLVEPGNIPSAHLHQIVGGNAFNATMPTDDVAAHATCTTCTFSDNFSNYWTAVLFFRAENGSYKRVPIMQNTGLPNGINGGMTVYYTQHSLSSNGGVKVTAFKPGFRMTVGNPAFASQPSIRGNPGLRFVCLDNPGTRFPELPTFPDRPCKAGIMTIHHFPACWDGKNLDTPSHQSHMYSTTRESFSPAGPCPPSHPVRTPQITLETLWDTSSFNHLWPADGSNPFVLSYGGRGDGVGYGTHADYVFGWKGDALQKAMDSDCMASGCENGRPLRSQSVQVMNKCAVERVVEEDIDGWLPHLPGQGPEDV